MDEMTKSAIIIFNDEKVRKRIRGVKKEYNHRLTDADRLRTMMSVQTPELFRRLIEIMFEAVDKTKDELVKVNGVSSDSEALAFLQGALSFLKHE